MKKILVAYFSASGVTAKVAKTLADVADADLYEIKPKVPYTQKDLDWMNPLSRSSKEMKGQSAYPELADQSADIQTHSVIMIGFPIWWYVAPTIINRFLESYDFSGKKIVLFATSGGSGFGKTLEKLRGSVSADTEVIEGKCFSAGVSGKELADWAAGVA